jgi:hypothetical protein
MATPMARPLGVIDKGALQDLNLCHKHPRHLPVFIAPHHT